ncbi:DUF3040 domain-containing protein [Nocardioides donggukensis]|uniref:DUF3040 domain-containing protein n=1 Tax=Nocardioides donggukensis TaxID=2774019 RepID=A0A927PZI6_9ACTN|nr:DUF3040 domain-containing protein [Nocardioides donggukensis]MBD8869205.1 DUF3040 domain-containing protein [Nocardioides donggukensis]
MPLSEEELRLLEQMERALVEEDPKFASTLRGSSFRRNARRKAIWAGFAFAVGVTVLMTGAIASITPVGILGFVIMLASATFGLTVLRGGGQAQEQQEASGRTGTSDQPRQRGGLGVIDGGRSRRPGKASRPSRPRAQGSFMERMEQRWRRRRDQNGGL